MPPVSFIKFKGKDHVCSDDKLTERLKDAIRFFNGTQVQNFPCEKPYGSTGVYAIYCVAKKGLYKAYGESVNRTAFNVPIYIGKALPKCKGFSSLPLEEQCDFWQRNFRTTTNISPQDFAVRILTFDDERLINMMAAHLTEIHSPVWNQLFNVSYTLEREQKVWEQCHDVRFRKKNRTCNAIKMRGQIETLLCFS